MSEDAEGFEMRRGTSGPGRASDPGMANGPVVEDNGPWFVVFIVSLVILFTAGFVAVIRSLLATF